MDFGKFMNINWCSTTMASNISTAKNLLLQFLPQNASTVPVKCDTFNSIDEFNFYQSHKLGNCGMIAALATIASNKDVFHKVVPRGQNFDVSAQSDGKKEFVFYLYKLGILNKVAVDKSGLNYSVCTKNSVLGPLLEKALVQLHFDGNYESSQSVPGTQILSSLANYFFEEHLTESDDSFFGVEELFDYGLKNRCQMILYFKDDSEEYDYEGNHYYTLMDASPDSVFLYDSHGGGLIIPRHVCISNMRGLEISYFENNIFRIPEIQTSVEFLENWPEHSLNKTIHFTSYTLTVVEEFTNVLINLIDNHYRGSNKKILIFDESNKIIHSSISTSLEYPLSRKSLRAVLNGGKYKIIVALKYKDPVSCQEYEKYMKTKFLFRLAASKKCVVQKSEYEEKYEYYSFKYLKFSLCCLLFFVIFLSLSFCLKYFVVL